MNMNIYNIQWTELSSKSYDSHKKDGDLHGEILDFGNVDLFISDGAKLQGGDELHHQHYKR